MTRGAEVVGCGRAAGVETGLGVSAGGVDVAGTGWDGAGCTAGDGLPGTLVAAVACWASVTPKTVASTVLPRPAAHVTAAAWRRPRARAARRARCR